MLSLSLTILYPIPTNFIFLSFSTLSVNRCSATMDTPSHPCLLNNDFIVFKEEIVNSTVFKIVIVIFFLKNPAVYFKVFQSFLVETCFEFWENSENNFHSEWMCLPIHKLAAFLLPKIQRSKRFLTAKKLHIETHKHYVGNHNSSAS